MKLPGLRCVLAIICITVLRVVGATQAASTSTPAPAQSALLTEAVPVQLKASDGVVVHGLHYKAPKPKALILLFHQAGSSKAEYASIAPRLVKAGYSALAIDQRSGGDMYGSNETATGLGAERAKALAEDAGYLKAYPDLEAALAWGDQQHLPLVLWGSSYSSALVFRLAAEHPGKVRSLLAFSPGEYFSNENMVRAAAAKIKVPAFVVSTGSDEERKYADPIFAVLHGTGNVRLVPSDAVHGSSMLIASRNPKGAETIWKAVLAFLGKTLG